MKYDKIWAFSDSYFPVYGQNHIRIFPYLDRITDSAQIQENMDTILPTYGKIQPEKAHILAYFTQYENSSWMLSN